MTTILMRIRKIRFSRCAKSLQQTHEIRREISENTGSLEKVKQIAGLRAYPENPIFPYMMNAKLMCSIAM